MADILVTIEEAARLEGIEYNSLVIRIQRGDDYKLLKEPDTENGGRERVLIAISSLSSNARKLYRSQQKAAAAKLQVKEDLTPWCANTPWYVHTDWAWYRDKHSDHYYKGLDMARHVEDCLRYEGKKDKTKFIEERAALLNISARSLHRQIGYYTEAAAWALEMSKDNNGNYDYFKILSLCQKPRAEVGRISLTEEMKVLIQNIWFEPMFAMNQCKYAKLYDRFKKAAAEKGWRPESLPCYATVCRYINDFRRNGQRKGYAGKRCAGV